MIFFTLLGTLNLFNDSAIILSFGQNSPTESLINRALHENELDIRFLLKRSNI